MAKGWRIYSKENHDCTICCLYLAPDQEARGETWQIPGLPGRCRGEDGICDAKAQSLGYPLKQLCMFDQKKVVRLNEKNRA